MRLSGCQATISSRVPSAWNRISTLPWRSTRLPMRVYLPVLDSKRSRRKQFCLLNRHRQGYINRIQRLPQLEARLVEQLCGCSGLGPVDLVQAIAEVGDLRVDLNVIPLQA